MCCWTVAPYPVQNLTVFSGCLFPTLFWAKLHISKRLWCRTKFYKPQGQGWLTIRNYLWEISKWDTHRMKSAFRIASNWPVPNYWTALLHLPGLKHHFLTTSSWSKLSRSPFCESAPRLPTVPGSVKNIRKKGSRRDILLCCASGRNRPWHSQMQPWAGKPEASPQSSVLPFSSQFNKVCDDFGGVWSRVQVMEVLKIHCPHCECLQAIQGLGYQAAGRSCHPLNDGQFWKGMKRGLWHRQGRAAAFTRSTGYRCKLENRQELLKAE